VCVCVCVRVEGGGGARVGELTYAGRWPAYCETGGKGLRFYFFAGRYFGTILRRIGCSINKISNVRGSIIQKVKSLLQIIRRCATALKSSAGFHEIHAIIAQWKPLNRYGTVRNAENLGSEKKNEVISYYRTVPDYQRFPQNQIYSIWFQTKPRLAFVRARTVRSSVLAQLRYLYRTGTVPYRTR